MQMGISVNIRPRMLRKIGDDRQTLSLATQNLRYTHFPYVLLLNRPHTRQLHSQGSLKHIYYRIITYLACIYIGGLEEGLEIQGSDAVGHIRLMIFTHTRHTELLRRARFQLSPRTLTVLLTGIILRLLPSLPQKPDRRLRDLPHGTLDSDRIKKSNMSAKEKTMSGSRQRMYAQIYDSSPRKASSSIQDAVIFAAFISNGSKPTTKIYDHMR